MKKVIDYLGMMIVLGLIPVGLYVWIVLQVKP
jgi:hypothetical protein